MWLSRGRLEDEGEVISFSGKYGDSGNGNDDMIDKIQSFRDELLMNEKTNIAGLTVNTDIAGYYPLRQWISEAYISLGEEEITPEHVLLTGSAEDGFQLLLRALIQPGDAVLVETPTSPEALATIRERGAVAVAVACDRDGMLPDSLRLVIHAARPTLVYVTPQFSNPSGRVWCQQRKLELLNICDRHKIPIIEDMSGGTLPFMGAIPGDSLYHVRQQQQLTDVDVIRIDTFGNVFPILSSVSWINSDPGKITLLALTLQKEDNRQGVDHQVMHQLLKRSRYWNEYAIQIEASYASRRSLMIELLCEQEWMEQHLDDPGGGHFLWVPLPAGLCSEALLRGAKLKGVSFMPSSSCYVRTSNHDHCIDVIVNDYMRLNYASLDEDQIRKGIALISETISEFTARNET